MNQGNRIGIKSSGAPFRGAFFISFLIKNKYIGEIMNASSDFPTIAVVGHFSKDEIISAEGSIKIAIGGTAYNLSALSSIMKRGRIIPVCRIGYDIRAEAEEMFKCWHGIDSSGVLRTRYPNVIHRLTYSPDGQRVEWNSGKQSPLPLGNLCRNTDAILLNFISGSDVRLAELQTFKKTYKGLIYCDYHSLSLGYSKDQLRYHRRHPRWREYLSAIDMVQMNINELGTILGYKPDGLLRVKEACRMLHDLGPKVINITMGKNGVIVSRKRPSAVWHIPAIKIGQEVDPTGCGDTFAGVFLHELLQSNDLIKAALIANRFAAVKATFSGLDGFNDIDRKVNQIRDRTRPILL